MFGVSGWLSVLRHECGAIRSDQSVSTVNIRSADLKLAELFWGKKSSLFELRSHKSQIFTKHVALIWRSRGIPTSFDLTLSTFITVTGSVSGSWLRPSLTRPARSFLWVDEGCAWKLFDQKWLVLMFADVQWTTPRQGFVKFYEVNWINKSCARQKDTKNLLILLSSQRRRNRNSLYHMKM